MDFYLTIAIVFRNFISVNPIDKYFSITRVFSLFINLKRRCKMKLKTLMIINTIAALVFGVAFVIVPAHVYSLYGITADEQLVYMGRLFGSALTGFALLTWLARNATHSDARWAIVYALFTADCLGFITALTGQIGNVVNTLGWSTVVIYLLLALGFGYFLFIRAASSKE
jgi:hypothetical protein